MASAAPVSRLREPWFVPLGLLVMGGVGVMYHQLLLWGWRLGGVGPVDRRTFGGALVLLLLGGLLAWGEGQGLRLLRRLALCASLGAAILLHWAWRYDLTDGSAGWIALLCCGVCGGGEFFWLFRTLWHYDYAPSTPAPFTLPLVGLWLASLVLPSMIMPYYGVLPGCLVYACVVAAWTLWGLRAEAADVGSPRIGRMAGMFGFLCALFFGVLLAQPGVVPGIKGQLPIDRDESGTLSLETSRRVDVLLVRGGWEGKQRWEFMSSDAHRAAEALVHPAMIGVPAGAHVILLGGEDGTALREILRYPGVAKVEVWSDLGHRLRWFRQQPLLRRLRGEPFADRRVRLRRFKRRGALLAALRRETSRFHRGFVAMAPPWHDVRTMPQMSQFFRVLARRLHRGGRLAALWGEIKPLPHYACMLRGLRKVGWQVQPYRSLGTGITWGLALAGAHLPKPSRISLPPGLRYLTHERLKGLFLFPPDADPRKASTHDCDE